MVGGVGLVRFGLPYQGSKSRIAEWVVEHLPAAPVLVDIMCGGGAVSHAAVLAGKWDRVVLNDVNGMADVFVKAARGEYADYSFVPDREQFFALRDSDPVVSLLYSFGNNRNTYLWSRTLEPVKLTASRMLSAGTLHERRRYWLEFCRALYAYVDGVGGLPNQLRQLEGLEGLERLERLQGLEASCLDYRQVELPTDAVVYVDPPYEGTDCKPYKGFAFDEFHEWLDTVPNLTVFSEYSCPPHCVEVARKEHYTTIAANANKLKCVEKLFVPERQIDEYRERMGLMI